jgi:hypothetical protein
MLTLLLTAIDFLGLFSNIPILPPRPAGSARSQYRESSYGGLRYFSIRTDRLFHTKQKV